MANPAAIFPVGAVPAAVIGVPKAGVMVVGTNHTLKRSKSVTSPTPIQLKESAIVVCPAGIVTVRYRCETRVASTV